MIRPATILRRALSVFLALAPLIAGADLCTIGALTGRADLACAMESGGPACRTMTVPVPKCSHCAPATPVKETQRPRGMTCCDLRPEADGAAGQPVLVQPSPVAHPASPSAGATPVLVVASAFAIGPDDDRAPPAGPPPPLSPRAPPLA
jgi:hypothetical protein